MLTCIFNRSRAPAIILIVQAALLIALGQQFALASSFHFLRATAPNTLLAIDPDITIRRIDPRAPRNLWLFGQGKGVPPFYYHTQVPGMYDRHDFFYPLGFKEESAFQSKLKFFPFFESRWSKIPPYDGFSRCLTLYQGRSDLGQEYKGFFPFYGYTFRRYGVDASRFFMFPLYYETIEDDMRTRRVLWPLFTYANSPGRQAAKLWPIIGTDRRKNDYRSWFILWPFLQSTDRHMGTEQAQSFRALPFPLYVDERSNYDRTTHFLWPIFSYYTHYASGHTRYRVFPLFSYGTGGGIEELSILSLYYQKKDHRYGTEKTSGGYVAVDGDEVFTEKRFLWVGRIQKRYRKGWLTFSRYRFWPFADYQWDREKGTHLKVLDVFPNNWDFWDVNMGKMLKFLDYRRTPFTSELSILFGLSGRKEVHQVPSMSKPPKLGDDDWNELILGSFGKR